MKVIYNSRRRVEGLIREKDEVTEVSERAGTEHIAEGIAKAVIVEPPKAVLIKKNKAVEDK